MSRIIAKVLTSATIIPAALYVPRDADRQVERLLSGMGRPGYVLVARQMGKTNLLINAKRQHEGADDLFLYCDLSNPLPTARDCFRSIIDTAMDSDVTRYADAKAEIERTRSRDLPAHKEHESELRVVLRAVAGRLVIILDEVDSLTRAEYSDQIFSQIRSTYFSRVNIKDFERLTYLLSGVAEPSELIRDPKLSPFNIGEKIYLDDFSETEYRDFLSLSGLRFDAKTAAHIFDWTRGSPRMTWDVCAELEDVLLSGRQASTADVDEAVKKLYLESFDRAPVDHVRSLAENDPEIRNALTELRYGKGKTISDAIRSKLYLAGIVGSGRDHVAVKNRILEAALSEQWLHDVEKRRHGLARTARDYLERKMYGRAVTAFQEYLAEGPASAADTLAAYDGLSQAHFASGDYAASLGALEGHQFDRERYGDPLYFSQLRRRASCYLRLRNNDEAVTAFRELVSRKTPNREFDAEINLGLVLYRTNPASNKDEILRLYNSAIDGILESPEMSAQQKSRLLDAGRYNLATALLEYGDRSGAVAQLEKAMETADERDKAFLLWEMGMLADDPLRRREVTVAGVDAMIATGFSDQSGDDDYLLDTVDQALGGLLALAFENDAESFVRLVDGAVKQWVRPGSGAVLPYLQSLLVAGRRDLAVATRLAKKLCASAVAWNDVEGIYICTKIAAYYDRAWRDKEGLREYVEALGQLGEGRRLDRIDVILLSQEAGRRVQEGNFEGVRKVLDLVVPHREQTPLSDLVLFDYYAMIAAGVSGDRDNERKIAESILTNLPAEESGNRTILSRRDAETIREAAELASQGGVRVPMVRHQKVGRNEWVTVRYVDGRNVRAKFKKVEADVEAARCVIVGREGPRDQREPVAGTEFPGRSR